MKSRESILIFGGLFIGILLIVLVLAAPPTWQGTEINYFVDEDTSYYHDLRNNISGFNDDVTFAFDSETNLTWTNSSGEHNVTISDVSNWISILSSTLGNLSINATYDNQTGFFVIPIQATNTSGGATVDNLEFRVNATNDAPDFTNINNTYNLTQNQEFFEYINATDEEEHYPLFFNISFFSNCTHASWSGRNEGENCSILNLTNYPNVSALMNFTPVRNDVGTYWANITVKDYGSNYACPHFYCDNDTYQQNKTSYKIVKFNVFSSLEVNITDCQNKIFQENSSGTCQINITTKDAEDSLNVSSIADLRNYGGSVSNESWFYIASLMNAVNNSKTIEINITPGKTEVGNWTINFTVMDLTSGENVTEQIYVYVNRTYNDAPEIVELADKNTSINLQTRINITVYDDDLLIPDKNESFGGYNETINFTVTILNQSNLSQELSLNGFDVEILSMPVSGTNRTEAKIEFTPNSTEYGDYTINITINDNESSVDSDLFNLSIINNHAPQWIESLITTFVIYENNETYLNLSQNITDSDGDTLTFSFTNDTRFDSFNLNSSTGIINFTSLDEDVGQHLVTITVSDGYLTNETTFNFTIYNLNDNPLIETPLQVNTPNASVESNSNITAQEDNYTTIILWVHDDDFKIPSVQTQNGFYNETLTINLTIEGPNINLFSFVGGSDWPSVPNRTEYDAIFTPNSTDVGEYNITINITDLNNSSNVLEFNLTISEANDAPIFEDLVNKTSAVNRTFYYDLNASDEEDGNDTSENLTFSYNFLSGTDFVNNDETIFNTTSGIFNITFNDTYAGNHWINITVNDSSNLTDSQDFWIYVYDTPNVTFPDSNYNFSLQENVLSNLTFSVNHSVQDNLTYDFYVDNVLRYNLSSYGNNTNLTWQFTPNFSDETYGQFENLTLIVYPSNSDLENKTDLNKTINWNVNITYTNSPISFNGHIGDKEKAYNQDITIDLTSYFSDIDYDDINYNQTINFSVASNSTPSYITSSVSSDWVLTLSSLIAVTELINITANDSINASTSNSFKIEFTTPSTTVVQTPSGGGGSSTIPVSPRNLQLIV